MAIAAAVLVLAGGAARGQDGQGLNPEQYRPRWQVGQQWVVESVNTQLPTMRDLLSIQPAKPIPWQFQVKGVEKIGLRHCFKVQVTCQVPGPQQPVTTLWVDQQTMTLQQLQTQLPVPGGLRTITESYRSASGQPTPVITPLTVLPLELPVFLQGSKGTTKFTYEAAAAPWGTKGVDDVAFAYEIEQVLTRPAPDQVKGLVPEAFTKDLQTKPVLEVRLKGLGSSRVRQLWQEGLPWPVFSDNGSSKARLVKVLPPSPHPQP
jgi:hypothetical protein